VVLKNILWIRRNQMLLESDLEKEVKVTDVIYVLRMYIEKIMFLQNIYLI